MGRVGENEGERNPGEGMADDMSEGMQCSDHPYRSNPGGVCAFCLQEKLGKLVSSKSSDPFFAPPPPSSSSSSPPSFQSSHLTASASIRMSFLSTKSRCSKSKPLNSGAVALKRSKSVAPQHLPAPLLNNVASNSPRKKSFWSFLTLVHSSSATIPSTATKRRSTSSPSPSSSNAGIGRDLPKETKNGRKSETSSSSSAAAVATDDDPIPGGSQASASFGRKVARSRSVGCGSRSFSGDFLERISNGLGDCALRRVESQREAKPKSSIHRHRDDQDNEDNQIKDRVKCSGIFGGFGVISSSTYWISATATAARAFDSRLPATSSGGIPRGRTKSLAWIFSSPMKAFRAGGSSGQTTIIPATNAAANPSMLVVRGT
ncbi:hypothetical protein HPP92_021051 [Vanilla planifolia]|uniref:Uncharacterized protein n=1 Tax=Vanilla planifolia TaxID=51239 RepID=A0A835PY69_VANPL|nr:hypothetical protein HPP92_021051 [Vanilla planifolia]